MTQEWTQLLSFSVVCFVRNLLSLTGINWPDLAMIGFVGNYDIKSHICLCYQLSSHWHGFWLFIYLIRLSDKFSVLLLDPDAMDTKGIPLTCRYNTRSLGQPIFDPLELSSSLDQTRGSNFPFYIRQQLAGILMRSFVLLIAYNWLDLILTAVCWCLELSKKDGLMEWINGMN